MRTLYLKQNSSNIKIITAIINRGGAGVLPTDTIYGIVGSALNKKAVSRIYKLRKRNPLKPFIILISSVNDLSKFSVKTDIFTKRMLAKVWPGKVSVVLACANKKFRYLHRGTDSLAFRLQKNKVLIGILKQTGPLIAPSANLEGGKPAKTIKEAQKYFGDKVDFYLNGGKTISVPSTLIKIENGKIKILRKGAVKIK